MRPTDQRYRTYDRNIPPLQRMTQGQMSSRNALEQSIRQTRNVQIGNTFNHPVRIGASRPSCIQDMGGVSLTNDGEIEWANPSDHNEPYELSETGYIWYQTLFPSFLGVAGSYAIDPDSEIFGHYGELELRTYFEGGYTATVEGEIQLLDSDGTTPLKWFKGRYSASARETETIARDGDGFFTSVTHTAQLSFNNASIEVDQLGAIHEFYAVKLKKTVSFDGFGAVGTTGGIFFFSGTPEFR